MAARLHFFFSAKNCKVDSWSFDRFHLVNFADNLKSGTELPDITGVFFFGLFSKFFDVLTRPDNPLSRESNDNVGPKLS